MSHVVAADTGSPAFQGRHVAHALGDRVLTVNPDPAGQSPGAELQVLDIPSAITNRIFSVKLLFATMQPPPVRPVLFSDGRQVGTVGMAVGAEHDRSSGIVIDSPLFCSIF